MDADPPPINTNDLRDLLWRLVDDGDIVERQLDDILDEIDDSFDSGALVTRAELKDMLENSELLDFSDDKLDEILDAIWEAAAHEEN